MKIIGNTLVKFFKRNIINEHIKKYIDNFAFISVQNKIYIMILKCQ